ncbi:MAG: AbrB/MazE/SpoVT family DNA-binding domain-containing protein, partial [Akkermansiaceae bacterium]
MSITIQLGKSGRLVVPKAIRDNLGLHEGSLLKL